MPQSPTSIGSGVRIPSASRIVETRPLTRPAASVRAWLISAEGHDAEPEPWKYEFAEEWLPHVDAGSRLTPAMVNFARTWFSDTVRACGYATEHALPAMDIVEECFARHPDNVEEFGRCMIRLVEFSLTVLKVHDKAARAPISWQWPGGVGVDGYLADLKVFDNPRLLATGLRLAQIIFAKTFVKTSDGSEVARLATRCSLTILPVKLFNYDPDLFERAVQRLSRTQTKHGVFYRSISLLAKIYAAQPELFNEGLDIVDEFYQALETAGIPDCDIENAFKLIVSSLVVICAEYSCKVLKSTQVCSTSGLGTGVATEVEVSAKSPEWFRVEITRVKDDLIKVYSEGKYLDVYIEIFPQIVEWVGEARHPMSVAAEIISRIHAETLGGADPDQVMHRETLLHNLAREQREHPNDWHPDRVAAELHYIGNL